MKVDLARTRRIAADWAESPYYELAKQWMEPFWGGGTPFRELFDQLNLGRVVELASGRGRHSEVIVGRCGHLTLIDINQTNIDACKSALAGHGNVDFIVNEGFDIPLPDESCDALFTYDSLVHFEADAVLTYIGETARVLAPGGRALFHYSNYDAEPGKDVHENPHWRNFMSQKLFHHFAMRRGLTILDSRLLAWGSENARVADLDCLTLVEKPRR